MKEHIVRLAEVPAPQIPHPTPGLDDRVPTPYIEDVVARVPGYAMRRGG